METFLALNGYDIIASTDEHERVKRGRESGRLGRPTYTEWLHCSSTRSPARVLYTDQWSYRCPALSRCPGPLAGRVDLGGWPPRSPTDPGLHNTRTRLLTYDFAALQGPRGSDRVTRSLVTRSAPKAPVDKSEKP